MPDRQVLLRIVPAEFRTPNHEVKGNLVFEKSAGGSRRLVGQIEELGKTAAEELIAGGSRGLQYLNAAGSVASILNLGVCAIGFLHVSKLLRLIEDRIERVDEKLEELTELVGVVDQKVDQLIDIGEDQRRTLAKVHDLIVSFETAKVHAALETLEYRSASPRSPERDQRLIEAAEVLQVFRNWLAEERAATIGPTVMAVRTELLRAEVATALAECRARCLAGDVEFARRAVERVLDGAQSELEQMYEWLDDHGGVRHLVMPWHSTVEAGTAPFDTVDAVEAVAWVKGVGLTDAAVGMLTKLRDSHDAAESDAQRQAFRGKLLLMGFHLSEVPKPSREEVQAFLADEPEPESAGGDEGDLSFSLAGLSEQSEVLSDARDAIYGDEGVHAQPCDAASLVATFRLARDLERAVATVGAMEVFGEPVRQLLTEASSPNSPALALEWTPQSAGESEAPNP